MFIYNEKDSNYQPSENSQELNISIKGDSFFTKKVTGVIRDILKKRISLNSLFSYISFIVQSDNNILYISRGTLYLNKNSTKKEFFQYLINIEYAIENSIGYFTDCDEFEKNISEEIAASTNINSTWNSKEKSTAKWYSYFRKFYRKNIEAEVEKIAVEYLSKGPRGPISTNNQHIRFGVMDMEMRIKKVQKKIEGTSNIPIWQKQINNLRKELNKTIDKQFKRPEVKKTSGDELDSYEKELRDQINQLENNIFQLKLEIQSKLVNRSISRLENVKKRFHNIESQNTYEHEINELGVNILKTEEKIKKQKAIIEEKNRMYVANIDQKLSKLKPHTESLNKKLIELFNDKPYSLEYEWIGLVVAHHEIKLDKLLNKKQKLSTSKKLARLEKQLVELKRERISFNFKKNWDENRIHFIDEFIEFLKQDTQNNKLIPEGYVTNIKNTVMKSLLYNTSVCFICSYVYLMGFNIIFSILLSMLGVFVFKPVAARFVSLILRLLYSPEGIKRMDYQQLKGYTSNFDRYSVSIDTFIFSGTEAEVDDSAHFMRKNIGYLKNTLNIFENLSIIYLVTSNTKDKAIIKKEKSIILRIQEEANALYGDGRVFMIYLHRKESMADKMGNVIASQQFKVRGRTKSILYTDKDKFILTQNPTTTFDHVCGDFQNAFGISRAVDQEGNEILLHSNEDIENAIFNGHTLEISYTPEVTCIIDNKNEIYEYELEKGIAVMLHPQNKHITILQPFIELAAPSKNGNNVESIYFDLNKKARNIHNNLDLNNLGYIYDYTLAFFGKGFVRTYDYNNMFEAEILNIQYILSHDWQESIFSHTELPCSSPYDVVYRTIEDNGKKCIYFKVNMGNVSELCRLFTIEDCHYLEMVINGEFSGRRLIAQGTDLNENQLISQVVSLLSSRVSFGERDLISFIGNLIRDTRWLKGDLQMLETIRYYKKMLPPYHKMHLEGIFRRFANDVSLVAWVIILALPTLAGDLEFFQNANTKNANFIGMVFFLISVVGVVLIEKFIAPIWDYYTRVNSIKDYETVETTLLRVKKVWTITKRAALDTIVGISLSLSKLVIVSIISIKIVLVGINKPFTWGGSTSNSAIVRKELSSGCPLGQHFRVFSLSIIIGMVMFIVMLVLVYLNLLPSYVFDPFHFGILLFSFLLGPVIAWLTSKVIYKDMDEDH